MLEADPDQGELDALFGNTPLSTPPLQSQQDVPATPSAGERNDTPSIQARGGERNLEPEFWVELPPLMSSAEREKYVSFASSAADDDDEDPMEVVYDVKLGGRVFYYARMRTGLYKKFSKGFFIENEESFGELVEEYLDAKSSGTLEPFDPSSRRVIPSDRMRPDELKLQNKTKKTARSIRRSGREMSRSESAITMEHTERSDEGEDEDEEDEFGDMTIRRSARATQANKLPFSPKKTRVIAIRASARNKGKEVAYNRAMGETDDDYDMLNSDDDDYEDGTGDKKKGPKTPRSRRAARPEYGFVRSTDDLQESESEGDPLMAHRTKCEKCSRSPAHVLMVKVKRKGKAGKRRRTGKGEDADLQDSDDDVTATSKLGGWVRCMKCCVSSHWKCLVIRQRDEILAAIKERQGDGSKPAPLSYDETTEFICDSCTRGGICVGCDKPVDTKDTPKAVGPSAKVPPAGSPKPSIAVLVAPTPESHASSDAVDAALNATPDGQSKQLLFRCTTCKRPAHYEHLPPLEGSSSEDVEDIASSYQRTWQCPDCRRWEYALDKILAWRPYPADAVEPPRDPEAAIKYKNPLPREYLVKWQRRSYRHLEWIPHQWLLSTNLPKLRHFLTKGTKVPLHLLDHKDVVSALQKASAVALATPDQTSAASSSRATPSISGNPDPSLPKRRQRRTNDADEEDEESTQELREGEPEANPYAELCIPRHWKTVDRVLDVLFLKPTGTQKPKRSKNSGASKVKQRINSDEEDEWDDKAGLGRRSLLVEGEEPEAYLVETADEREARSGSKISGKDMCDAVWVFIKWQDLAYDDAAWDSPPRPSDLGYTAYTQAFHAYADGLKVKLITLKPAAQAAKDAREPQDFPVMEKATFSQGGTLLPFQLEGVTWLYRGWHNQQTGILGDEMGLGKTVQMITFLGMLVQEFIFPILVVVPNSTIANWMREFQRWAPHVRAVQYCGVAESRAVIREYELYHKGSTELKFHVLVATFETITNPKEFNMVFGRVKRWEALIVDEGQRLKSDSSLIFRRLGELNTMHRIIMTGTPLQNNIRELFALMNFLDPDNWSDLNSLEAEFEELNDEKLADLRSRLKPYFLRRIKSDVMDLPPKNEVIVPLSMVPIQKVVYKSLLENNLDIIGSLTTRIGQAKNRTKNLMNILMQLRKCMQHPYLVDQDLEPKDLGPEALHQNIVDTSSKLQFLQMLLPKLKQRGHRVLLFSQFKINLDFVEDFLTGEGHKFLRLDGDMAQIQRQRDMDRFNEKDSDIFIYILSTRAGGVGINLWSADTVIVFDPDFNPHQDLQAIARAHRMGQTKKVIVFKLMIKNAAEEKIVQVGKKKLALDHLIVQKMDDEDGREDVQGILSFGAKALFENDDTHDIRYSDQDVDKLIDKIEQEEPEPPAVAGQQSSLSFGFAKIWEADKNELGEVKEAEKEEDMSGYWAERLVRANLKKAALTTGEPSGRGVRRKATRKPIMNPDELDSPENHQPKKVRGHPLVPDGTASGVKSNRSADSDSDWGSRISKSAQHSSDDSDDAFSDSAMDIDRPKLKPRGILNTNEPAFPFPDILPSKSHTSKSAPASRPAPETCNLCHKAHGDKKCQARDDPEILLATRETLLASIGSSPQKTEALRLIDQRLNRLRQRALVAQRKWLSTAVANASQNAYAGPSTIPSPNPYSARGLNGVASLPVDLLKPKPQATTAQPLPGHADFTLIARSTSTAQSDQPSKRTAEASGSPRKKTKLTSVACPLCHQTPHHITWKCPRVTAGTNSIQMLLAEHRDGRTTIDNETLFYLQEQIKANQKRELGVAAEARAAGGSRSGPQLGGAEQQARLAALEEIELSD